MVLKTQRPNSQKTGKVRYLATKVPVQCWFFDENGWFFKGGLK
jgi:hypothetical protein